ncbi:MAG TPA: Ig-like domain repeat protein [Thermoanaerobaculia bacterium]|nr:Ig-like domain repeat protein [Thermoanaerobaculia bacterium]
MFVRAFALVVAALCLATPSYAITRSWTGAVSDAWSEPGNWSPAGVPASVDVLVFPAGVTRTVMNNDLPAGTSVGPMDFRTAYTLNGNPLTLTGDLTFGFAGFTCNADLALGANVTLGAASTSTYNGAIDVNSHTLTIHSYNTTLYALDGSGTIAVTGAGITIAGSGSFSGNVTGTIDLLGALPDATFTGSLSGNGTAGAATVQFLFLGTKPPCCGDTHAIGTLQTKSVSIGGPMYADLVPAGTSDRLQVTGSVTLGGGALNVAVPSGSIGSGETFTLIDNDGSDAITGTFDGLPEGASIALPGATVTISYAGGDGNDVVLTATSASRSWTGASSALWSDPANWSPAGVPSAGEALIFPVGAARTVMTNDLAGGATAGAMDFRASYTLSGNPLTLTGDVTFAFNAVFTCNVDLELGADVTLGAAGTSTYNGAIDVNGHTLGIRSYNTTIAGPIEGSGAIAENYYGLTITSSGSFSGPIAGNVNLVGSMPNASFTGWLAGAGTLGAVTTTGRLLPGATPPCCGDTHAIGTLHTQSVTIGGDTYVDLVPAGTSDRIDATGSVTIGTAWLHVTVLSGSVAGQSFTIIENDGTDPVAGTFSGLPEGAQIALPGGSVAISYAGGDGNDVVLTAVSASKAWTGANSALWSDPGNWSPAAIPSAGEPLLFPHGSANHTMTNDLPAGTSVGPMEIRVPSTLNGNALTLTGDITLDHTAPFVVNLDLALGANVRLGGAVTSTYHGGIDVGSHTLTVESYNTTFNGPLAGDGSIVVTGSGMTFAGSGAFSGTIRGTADITGSLPNAAIIGPLSGNGTVGAATVAGALILGPNPPCCGDAHQIGTLHTQSISIDGRFHADLVPGGTSDLLEVTGAVTLGDVSLQLTVPTGSPAAGDTFTIIDNDGTDAVSGTFAGQAEDSIVDLAPWKFRITYAGGDGNDVVLTAIEPTEIETEQNAASTQFGEGATFSVRVVAREGVPNGSVTFTDNGAELQTLPLVNGAATLNATLEPGVHALAAVYDGTPLFAPSAAAMTHEVLRGRTTATLSMPEMPHVHGDPLNLRVIVQPVAPAFGTATGTVTVQDVGSATLENGTAVFPSIVLDAGTYILYASYPGDARFDGSSSTPAMVTVRKAATVTSATATGSTLTVGVSATARPGLDVTGVVTVSENGTVIAQQAVAAGTVVLDLSALSSGDHHLDIAFLGNGNFEPSSTAVDYAAGPPQVSVRDVVVIEGNSGEASVTLSVELSSSTMDAVIVGYATEDGTASSGADYAAASGTLTFAPGETVKTIALRIAGDATPEDDETFAVQLASPVNATLGRSRANVQVVNDDLTYRAAMNLPYGYGLTLDLYTPSEGTGPFPLIVWVPGADAYDAEGPVPAALRQTGRGFAVAVVRYRPVHVARFPAQLDDLRNAIAWLRTNGSSLQLSTERIAAWGSSAGAHLASLLGTMNDGSVQAVVAWGGASDLLHLQGDGVAAGCRTAFDERNSPQSQLLGCALQSCPRSAADASPLAYVTPDDPPFLLVHAREDCVVPSAQSTRLYDALRAAGVGATLRLLDAPGVTEADAFLDAQLKSRRKQRAVR